MKKILLIDDSDYIVDGTSALLRFEGYEVLTANNGATGVELAIAHHPDLVICDISMPTMDGFEVLRELRSHKDTESMRFMFLTARADKGDMRTGMEFGADDYLLKPFTVEELLSAIDAQWKKRDSIQRGYEEIKMSVTYALPHEFRTALNQIIGSASFLSSTSDTDEKISASEIATDIIISAKRLLKITENFLVYAQLESIAANPQAREALLDDRSQEAAAVISDIAQTKAESHGRFADLSLNCDIEGVTLALSNENLHKIFDEFLDNSFKFSEAGTRVEVDASLTDEYLRVRITDCGHGMTPAQIAATGAYNQFGRMVHEQQGVGLGFIIARRLVELHKGSFVIHSEHNVGTVLHIELPLAPKRIAAADANENQSHQLLH